MPTVTYSNAFELAKEVYKYIKTENNPYSMKIKSYQNPANSLCWIGPPRVDWPAYRNGKYCFFNEEIQSKHAIFCGVHLERGYGPTMEETKRKTFTPSWTWSKLLRSIDNGSLDTLLKNVEQFSKHITFQIEISSQGIERDKLIFISQNDTVRKHHNNPLYFISDLDITDMQSPIDALKAINAFVEENDFLWIDCFVGFYVGVSDDSPVYAQEIWEKGLSFLDTFVE